VHFPAAVASGKVFEGVNLNPQSVVASGTYFDFVGSYVQSSDMVQSGDYVIADGALKKAVSAVNLKGTRTYFKIKSAAARSLKLAFGEEIVTGITELPVNGAAAGRCYNLNGQQVEKPMKGLYIMGGKKVMK